MMLHPEVVVPGWLHRGTGTAALQLSRSDGTLVAARSLMCARPTARLMVPR
jgi:hypothetical protein